VDAEYPKHDTANEVNEDFDILNGAIIKLVKGKTIECLPIRDECFNAHVVVPVVKLVFGTATAAANHFTIPVRTVIAL
jgi:hypothetical protein